VATGGWRSPSTARLRALSLAQELGNVRAACRAMGIHPSTYYRWKHQVERFGPDILMPRERRRPKMANQTSPFIEQRVLAFCLGHPGFGPMRVSAELRRGRWGGIRISPNGVWRVLKRHGLETRAKRLGLVAGYAAPPEPERSEPEPERHLEVSHPGELVQMDCFFIREVVRDPGHGVAVHRHRRGFGLLLGRSCTSPPATPRPGGPPTWLGPLPRTCPGGDGGFRG
jgi:transposase